MLFLEDNLPTKATVPDCLEMASTWTGNDYMWVSDRTRGTDTAVACSLHGFMHIPGDR